MRFEVDFLERTRLEQVAFHRGEQNVDQQENKAAEGKLEWVRPELQRLEAGSAESQGGSQADGGGGAQGS